MATKKSAVITIRLDASTKDEAKKVFEALGMDMSTGINVYLKQVVRDQALPFNPTIKDPLDQATERSLQDLKNGRYEDFANLADLFKGLHQDH
ncbi:type II toxin-antitoxin system RelB/DinJ family antitoxin [Lacticaseibacillus paracasei]|uniref:type II toxin-antitoxin system RelB/DinJ family antitoxin n=1 Tax=Lacticaseibacillus paracasei TaxID=1597 RepID=UPI0016513C33|nr:type II toxin-antitoxin system RelB/DinJ family antitoxin [Lacticaseibacillus paracasei]